MTAARSAANIDAADLMWAPDLTLDVGRLEERQLSDAAALLAEAFAQDPLMTYVFKDVSERDRRLAWHFETAVRYGHLFGEVSVLSDSSAPDALAGVAVWVEMGDASDSLDRMERSGMARAPDVLGMDAFMRYVGVLSHLESLRKRDVPAHHWYLWLIAISSKYRGQGLGGMLMRPMLERADDDRVPCYLETFNAASLPFYHRLGFGTRAHDVEPRSGIPFWTLLRDPGRPVAGASTAS